MAAWRQVLEFAIEEEELSRLKAKWRTSCASTAKWRSSRWRQPNRQSPQRSPLTTRMLGIQAIATTAPDLPPKPSKQASFARDHEYQRHGRLSLLAGNDLLTGQVQALVNDRHRSREFVEFLKLLDAAYPAGTATKTILDYHSAYISKETKAWLAAQPAGPLPVHFHTDTTLLAQSDRGFLLQAAPLDSAPYPRRLQTGT